MSFLKKILLCLCITNSAWAFTSDVVATVPVMAQALGNSTVTTNAVPMAPSFTVQGYILIDANSGYVIAEKNADAHLPPASLTKIMTLYLAAEALQSGRVHFEDMVPISGNAWRKGGSRMFIKVGSVVPVKDLINGIVIASGNDATVAMAEYLGGSEDAFANLMNKTAAALGMKDTHYVDSNGLPEPTHYSSPRDIATLARAWILTFPQYYPWFKQQWFEYNGIKQPNRNRLLWHDPSVDGMKTGHTDDAGYCLVASAQRNGMRLIAVVMGAINDKARTDDTEGLLNYGFRFFETQKLYSSNTVLVAPRVWFGKKNTVPLGVKNDLYVTVPVGRFKDVKISVSLSDLKAPIVKGQVCGVVNVTLDDKIIAIQPLIALNDNLRGGIFSVGWDKMAKVFSH